MASRDIVVRVGEDDWPALDDAAKCAGMFQSKSDGAVKIVRIVALRGFDSSGQRSAADRPVPRW
ncbi:hypothetical protein ACFXPS_25505 [Nocardia sp. NPDC059091]|uniref:hypothetical protein n=1 Tax=unclassified Nocardia TaxID=2637762 RepID=UPI0036CA1D13